MKIFNLGYLTKIEKDFCVRRPNGSGDYMMLFLRTGAIFVLNGSKVKVEPSTFFLYRKGTPQYFYASDGKYVNDWIHFDMDQEEERQIEEMGIPFDTPVRLDDIVFFSNVIRDMCLEEYSVNRYKKETLELYFKLIILKLAERLSTHEKQTDWLHYKEIADLRAKIYYTPDFDWTMEYMAQSVALSVSYFQHLYKSIFQKSALADVISARIERAKHLLANTDFSVARIAAECGYRNDVHFMRQFKREAGVTPSEYRKLFYLSPKEVEEMQTRLPYNIPKQM